MKKYGLLFALLCAFHLSVSSQSKVTTADSITSYLERIVKENNLPGMNFTYVSDDGWHHDFSVGLSDVEKEIPLTTKNTFFSGSIGKTYAATIIFQLIDEQKLAYDQLFKSYFPEIDWLSRLPNIDEITIEMLLTHSSGLPRYVLLPEIWNQLHENPDKVWNYKDRLSVIFDKEPIHEAGKGFAYSDTNYILLGMLIEKLTNKPYYELIQETILTPYELSTTYPSLQRDMPHLAVGYSKMPPSFMVPNKTVTDASYIFNPQFEWTGGGFASTVSDLAQWATIYYTGKLFSDLALKRIQNYSPEDFKDGKTMVYSMGSFVFNTPYGIAYGHSGFMPGFNSIFMYYPELKIGAAIQSNCDYVESKIRLHDLMNQLIGIVKSN